MCGYLVERTYIHPFNGPLSQTTRVSRYQKGRTNLNFTEARDSEWQWYQLQGSMQVWITMPWFFTVRVPFCRPTNSIKALKALISRGNWLGWTCRQPVCECTQELANHLSHCDHALCPKHQFGYVACTSIIVSILFSYFFRLRLHCLDVPRCSRHSVI